MISTARVGAQACAMASAAAVLPLAVGPAMASAGGGGVSGAVLWVGSVPEGLADIAARLADQQV
jgi:hypothetical protein